MGNAIKRLYHTRDEIQGKLYHDPILESCFSQLWWLINMLGYPNPRALQAFGPSGGLQRDYEWDRVNSPSIEKNRKCISSCLYSIFYYSLWIYVMEVIFYEEANKRYLKRATWSTKNYFSLVLFLFLGLYLETYFRRGGGKQTRVTKIVHQPVSEADLQIFSWKV